jgi:hypothetical protein
MQFLFHILQKDPLPHKKRNFSVIPSIKITLYMADM